MIVMERLGIRNGDDNPVIETSTYIPAAPDHPNAVELDGYEGTWVLLAVGNAFNQVNARPVSRAEYDSKVAEIQTRIESQALEAQEQRERAMAELAEKKEAVSRELATLGLSPSTIKAILDQVKG